MVPGARWAGGAGGATAQHGAEGKPAPAAQQSPSRSPHHAVVPPGAPALRAEAEVCQLEDGAGGVACH